MNVGSRHGVPVVLGIKAEDMMRDGFEFFISNNGVILVDHVPARYLENTYSKSPLVIAIRS
jgi:putative RNA 2'-phosphotransferase